MQCQILPSGSSSEPVPNSKPLNPATHLSNHDSVEATVAFTDECARLYAVAQDALARGFSILAVEPRDKGPYARYSKHAVNSATTDHDVALLPYVEGAEANFGVACGKSGLTVVDVDHGIKSHEELTQWMFKNNLPPTLTVQSGRDTDDKGYHLYYSGPRQTTDFNLDGVTGELKSNGGYVVGPGSRHPSGKLYEIVHDVDIAPFPEAAFPNKSKYESQGTPSTGLPAGTSSQTLVPASQRNGRLTSLAGSLRNKHLNEDTIFAALRDFAINQCEDGENYFVVEEAKLKDLSHRMVTKYTAEPLPPLITIGKTPAPALARLNLVRGDTVKAEKITWLWTGKIPVGKLTLFVGHPGIGKGLCTTDIAARLTTGKDFPDSANTFPASEVIICSSEDDAGDTLKPRLMAAGADDTKWFIIPNEDKVFSLDTDLPALKAELQEHPAVRLVIIDPVMNHCGQTNGYKEQDLRRVLTPLGKLAQEFKIAVIVVTHFNKKSDAEMIARVGGAMALVGCVRSAWSFTESRDEEGVRLMLPMKSNLSASDKGIQYEIDTTDILIEGDKVEMARIKWGVESHEKASSALASFNEPKVTKVTNAMGWLASYLSDGTAHHVGTMTKTAELSGHNKVILDKAYKKLSGMKTAQKADGWYWQLPFKPDPIEPIEPATQVGPEVGIPETKETL